MVIGVYCTYLRSYVNAYKIPCNIYPLPALCYFLMTTAIMNFEASLESSRTRFLQVRRGKDSALIIQISKFEARVYRHVSGCRFLRHVLHEEKDGEYRGTFRALPLSLGFCLNLLAQCLGLESRLSSFFLFHREHLPTHVSEFTHTHIHTYTAGPRDS